MSEKVSVMGIMVDNYTAADAMEQVVSYLHNDCINTVCMVSSDLLLEAGEDDEVRTGIENMDLTIVEDPAIFDAAGAQEALQTSTKEEDSFLIRLLKYAAATEKSIFLLYQKDNKSENYGRLLRHMFRGLSIVGEYAVAPDPRISDDMVINEINSAAPDIILTALKSPMQERFVSRNKNKLGAKVWVGMDDFKGSLRKYGLKEHILNRIIGKAIFKRKVTQYINEKESDQ